MRHGKHWNKLYKTVLSDDVANIYIEVLEAKARSGFISCDLIHMQLLSVDACNRGYSRSLSSSCVLYTGWAITSLSVTLWQHVLRFPEAAKLPCPPELTQCPTVACAEYSIFSSHLLKFYNVIPWAGAHCGVQDAQLMLLLPTKTYNYDGDCIIASQRKKET